MIGQGTGAGDNGGSLDDLQVERGFVKSKQIKMPLVIAFHWNFPES